MILSDIAIKDIAYELVMQSPLSSMIEGKVYKGNRPMNSDSEDIDINVLTNDAAQTQEATLNINLFVKDENGRYGSVEDTKRLRELADECISLLESKMFEGLWFSLESQRVMAVDGVDFHFINNKVTVKCYTV